MKSQNGIQGTGDEDSALWQNWNFKNEESAAIESKRSQLSRDKGILDDGIDDICLKAPPLLRIFSLHVGFPLYI